MALAKDEEARKRQLANLRPAKKGEVRNPLGPKACANYSEVVAICRDAAPRLLARIIERIEAGDFDDDPKQTAAFAIIERGWGKPKDMADERNGAMTEATAQIYISLYSRFLEIAGRGETKPISAQIETDKSLLINH